jgi:hypothetical protein
MRVGWTITTSNDATSDLLAFAEGLPQDESGPQKSAQDLTGLSVSLPRDLHDGIRKPSLAKMIEPGLRLAST